jgi:hypothetical protein
MIKNIIKIAVVLLLISLFLPTIFWLGKIIITLILIIWLISLL